jgi:antibiotic biosynthesis monooxygenase (ABM) superfamily enzyme
MYTGFYLWIFTFFTLIILLITVCWSLILNYIILPKDSRENLYYYLKHKQEIKEYIKTKVKL